MPETKTCSECGVVIPATSREGYCPKCLLGLANTVALDEVSARRRSVSEGTPPSGSSFSNYELLESIGEGGMGVVYKARQRGLNRIVALKMIRSGSLASESEVKRFRSEAQAAARLQHPNVVAIHEVGEHEGRPFFTMDFIEGQNLAQVAQGTPLAAERAARYVHTIAEAVHCAHQLGILHRDLKPANILLDRNDQPRITDFGLAKRFDTDSEFTASGAILGTPSYMPPEQASGQRKEIGPASDGYSLGAILYDLLTGRPPFRAETPLDTLRQVIDTQPAPPRLLNPKVPKDLETICLKCLAKETHLRYRSAQDLADDLGRFLNGQPIKARPISRAERVWRWSRRNPSMAGLTATTTAFAVALGISAVLFRSELMAKNENMARLLEPQMTNHLHQLSRTLLDVAQTGEFQTMVQSSDTNGLFNYLRQEAPRLNAGSGASAEVENWVVMDLAGNTLARVPLPNRLPITNRSSRDYFLGALPLTNSPPGDVYFSRLYKSKDDDKFKFGVSAIVWERRSPTAKPVGVVTLMINTGSAEKYLGWEFSGQRIVLLAPPDPRDEELGHAGTNDFFVFLHPNLGNGDQVAGPVNITKLKRWRWYRDPVVGGPWLAGVSEVRGTPYRLVIQSRDWVRLLSRVCLLLAVILGAAFGFRWLANRNERRREISASA